MIWIDSKASQGFKKAINAFNFDKVGNETGLGSWGVLGSHKTSSGENVNMYIGAKNDVLTISTDVGITSFINLDTAIKEQIDALKRISKVGKTLAHAQEYTKTEPPNDAITFYLKDIKIEIDTVEFINRIYKYQNHIDQYIALEEQQVFKTNNLRSMRAISCTPLAVFDIDTISFIFSKENTLFVINEQIVEKKYLHDELRFGFWFTPHEAKVDNIIVDEGRFQFQTPTPYMEKIDGVALMGNKEAELIANYALEGFRHGYYDLTVEEPRVAHSFGYDDQEYSDTYFIRKELPTMKTPSNVIVELDSTRYVRTGRKIAESILVHSVTEDIKTRINSAYEAIVLIWALEKLEKPDIFASFYNIFNEELKNLHLPEVLAMFKGRLSNEEKSTIYKHAQNTTIVPFVCQHKLYNWQEVIPEVISNSVIFLYNPILKKYAYYEFEAIDSAKVSQDTIIFEIEGLKYGYQFENNIYGTFYWGNETKEFRNRQEKWVNAKGELYDIGQQPDITTIDPIDSVAKATNGKMPVYKDLYVQETNDFVKAIVISKNDLESLANKRHGVFRGGFILGQKSGFIEIKDGSIWI